MGTSLKNVAAVLNEPGDIQITTVTGVSTVPSSERRLGEGARMGSSSPWPTAWMLLQRVFDMAQPRRRPTQSPVKEDRPVVTPKDWTLLVIAAAKRPLSPVQLQKSLFLLSENLKPQPSVRFEFHTFEPYNYGPFSRAVYDDAAVLQHHRLVRILTPPLTRYDSYSITPRGVDRALEIQKRLPKAVADYVHDLVEWTTSLSFNQLVAAVYKNYPEMKVNSVFRD
jgi:uncharacterized protein